MVDEQQPDESSSELDRILLEYFRRIDADEEIDQEKFLAEHPEHADALADFLSAEQQFQPELTGSPQDTPTLLSESVEASGMETRLVLRYFGDYELLEEIARGGMGIVYKARQTSLNRIVAVKMILAGQLARESDVQRFRAEAEAAAKLQHPHIVQIYEVGEQDGQHYFSMEYIEGSNLAEMVRDYPLPAREAAQIVSKVAGAIEYAHEQGVLHRDLKPSNVLIDARGEVKVTDFGLAKQLESDQQLTQTDQILGTPSYMPPEQAKGNQALMGPTADMYSLGAVLYHLLTGRPPFAAATQVETIHQVIHHEPVSPRLLEKSLPKDLETICQKCLQKEPHRRYGRAQDLTDDLQRFLENRPIIARPISRPARLWRWCRRRPLVASLSVAFVLALMGGTAFSTYYAYVADQNAAEAFQNATNERLAREEADEQREEAEVAKAEALDAKEETERELHRTEALRLTTLAEQTPDTQPLKKLELSAAAVRATNDHGEEVLPEAHQALIDNYYAVGGESLNWEGNPYRPYSYEFLADRYGKICVVQNFRGSQIYDLTTESGFERPKFVLVNEDVLAVSPNGQWLITERGFYFLENKKIEKGFLFTEFFIESDKRKQRIRAANEAGFCSDARYCWGIGRSESMDKESDENYWRSPDDSEIAFVIDMQKLSGAPILFEKCDPGEGDVFQPVGGIDGLFLLGKKEESGGISYRIIDVEQSPPRAIWSKRFPVEFSLQQCQLLADKSHLILIGRDKKGEKTRLDNREIVHIYSLSGSADTPLWAHEVAASHGSGRMEKVESSGRWLLVEDDGLVKLWNTSTFPLETSLELGTRQPNRYRAFRHTLSDSGNYLTLIHSTNENIPELSLWNLSGDSPDLIFKLRSEKFRETRGGFLKSFFSGSGRWFALSTEENEVLLWDLQSPSDYLDPSNNKPKHFQPYVLKGHDRAVGSVLFAQDEKTMVTYTDDYDSSPFRKWDLEHPVPGNREIIVKDPSRRHRYVDTQGVRALLHGPHPGALKISSDQNWIAAVDSQPEAIRWNSRTLKTKTVRLAQIKNTARPIPFNLKTPTELRSFTFSRDSRWLIAATVDERVFRWDLTHADPTGTREKVLDQGEILALPRHDRALIRAEDDMILLWDVSQAVPSPYRIPHISADDVNQFDWRFGRKENCLIAINDGTIYIADCGKPEKLEWNWRIDKLQGELINAILTNNREFFLVSLRNYYEVAPAFRVFHIEDRKLTPYLTIRNDVFAEGNKKSQFVPGENGEPDVVVAGRQGKDSEYFLPQLWTEFRTDSQETGVLLPGIRPARPNLYLPPGLGHWVELSTQPGQLRPEQLRSFESASRLSLQGKTLAVTHTELRNHRSIEKTRISSNGEITGGSLRLPDELVAFSDNDSYAYLQFLPGSRPAFAATRITLGNLVRNKGGQYQLMVGPVMGLVSEESLATFLDDETVLVVHTYRTLYDFRGGALRRVLALFTTDLESLLSESSKKLQGHSGDETPLLPARVYSSYSSLLFQYLDYNHDRTLSSEEIAVDCALFSPNGNAIHLPPLKQILEEALSRTPDGIGPKEFQLRLRGKLHEQLFSKTALTMNHFKWIQYIRGQGVAGRISALRIPAIRRELELDDQQVNKIDDVLSEYADSERSLSRVSNSLSRQRRSGELDEYSTRKDAVWDERESLTNQTISRILNILDERQRVRLQQIDLQGMGLPDFVRLQRLAANGVFDDPVHRLHGAPRWQFTDQQEELIQKTDELYGRDYRTHGDGQDFNASYLEYPHAIYPILTPEQRRQWQELTGPPFEIELTADELEDYGGWPRNLRTPKPENAMLSSAGAKDGMELSDDAKMVFMFLDVNADRQLSPNELSLSAEVQRLFAEAGESVEKTWPEANLIERYGALLREAKSQ